MLRRDCGDLPGDAAVPEIMRLSVVRGLTEYAAAWSGLCGGETEITPGDGEGERIREFSEPSSNDISPGDASSST